MRSGNMPIIVNVDVMLAKRKMTSGELAEKVGISRQSLSQKLNGEREFAQGEILAIKNNLRLSDDEFMQIFFNPDVDENSTKETV